MAQPLVYQAADGRWIVFSNGIKSGYFLTEEDANLMSEKIEFTEEMQATAKAVIDILATLEDFEESWVARGYGAGGANEISDLDIASTGNTAAEVGAFITFAENVRKFVDNLTPTAGDYRPGLYKLLKKVL